MWKSFFKTLAHAAIGGAGVALASIPLGSPVTSKTVLIPALISAATSCFSAMKESTLPGVALAATVAEPVADKYMSKAAGK